MKINRHISTKYIQPKLVLGAKLRFGCYMPTVFIFKNSRTNLLSAYNKTISVLLLFYFLISPLLNALPHQECNEFCSMKTMSCNAMVEVNNDCCNMMMNSYSASSDNENSCEMKFDMNNCMITKDLSLHNIFVVTQKFQSEQNFSAIAILTDEQSDNNYKLIFNNSLYLSQPEKSPPIYITVQSFLI